MKIKTLFLLVALTLNIFPQDMNNSFNDFLIKVRNAPEQDKQLLADEFISGLSYSSYPIFENDSTVVLLFKGDVDSVRLLGDMTNWSSSIPLERIKGTDLFFFRGTYESEARFEYLFEIKKDEFPLTDKFNEYKSLNGLWEMSELAMPRYERHPVFSEYERGKKGDTSGLKALNVPSGILGYDHTVHVYLPPDYDPALSYPSVYFQDGLDYIEFGLAPHILNEMISAGGISPVIAVFVTPPNLHQPKVPNRMTEYGMNDDYVNFFAEELVAHIDSLYPTIKDPRQRLVIGDSYGGLISTYISFSYPEVFGNAYSQSAYFSFSKDKLIRLMESSPVRPVRLYVDIGTYEETVGAAFLPADEVNFIEGNRRMKKVLEDKGYDFVYREYYEGHTWGNWRRHLIDAFLHFFGTVRKES